MDGVKEAVTNIDAFDLGAGKSDCMIEWNGQVWSIGHEMWISEWHGTEVQVQDLGLVCGR